ncbi:PilT/PilU family type 4a pilus ATPase [Candidatus Fukatsuia endosymbiont of Tuberolachnus salignus]|uniref:type IV pilus twitching motility protein PilT n=1 Tax=Candidatus Fukatsuia endosymbiont of Tuberolachnus salignus TaxID=3077957 RepID=UPI00313DF371
MDFEEFVAFSVKHKASDLHLCSGHHPRLRIDGVLQSLQQYAPLSDSWTQILCQQLLNERQYLKLQQKGQLDFSYTTKHGQRLRGNFFQQQHGLSVAFRLVSSHCPELKALAAPAIIERLMQQEDGLILVTGATGNGKSTTLNAIIGAIHQQGGRHIITLEDPIEYIHNEGSGLIQQRDLSCHTHCASAALNAALRQDPDIILLGELRDTASIRLALTAAETGHLVLATLHTRTAAQAVDRLIDVFPAEEKACVRGQLAAGLVAVIAQKLARKRGGGRIALFEILVRSTAVSNLIREGKTHQLEGVMQTNGQLGMQTFSQGIQQRQKQKLLAEIEQEI